MLVSAFAQGIVGARKGEAGGTLVMVVLFLPVVMLFAVFVVDVGNWFVHKRHLQLQADAGALAGGGSFTYPCTNDTIVERARTYAGDPSSSAPYNTQIPPTEDSNVHVLVNSGEYWNEGGADYSDGGPPCSARMVDVKITESDLPWYFQIATVPAINAHARVEVQGMLQMGGALPVAVPDVEPNVARAYFVDEATGTELASTPLTKTGTSNGMTVWDNSAAPLSVPISASRIGVRIALGGGSTTTCGGRFVACYDLGSSNGLVHVRGWSSAGSGAQPNPPIARDVRLFAGSCPDAYFSTSTSSCSIGVSAVVDFGTSDPVGALGASLTAVIGGVPRPLTYDSATGRWVSTGTNFFSVAPNAGPLPVELRWEETKGQVQIGNKLESCKVNGNKCLGTLGVVHRTFAGSEARSGAIKVAEVSENGVAGANSFQLGATHDLVVRIGVAGNLVNATSVSDPPILMRVTGSQNQSVDCDPDLPNLREEIRNGCAPNYAVNTGSTCPATATALWATAQPWDCAAIQTGGAVGQVEQGMRDRINGGSNQCQSPNNWSSFPDLPTGDPRIVPIFVTPFGTFEGSGNDVVPVKNFAVFYVTGWFSSPCSGDDPVPDKGYIVGHFIKYVFSLNSGGGSGELCDFNAFGSCVAVMTE